jgi:localization factor PodJL
MRGGTRIRRRPLATLHGPLRVSQRRENEDIPSLFGNERVCVSVISPRSVAGSFKMSVPEAPAQAAYEGLGASPVGSWQQAAGIFSAIANMLSSDLTTHETDRQNRADLIQKLDELETTLRNGGSDDNDSLKAALTRLEAELRAWRGMPNEGAPSGQEPALETGGQGASEGTPREAVETPSNLGDSLGSLEQFGALARDVQDSLAQFGVARARRPLIERQGAGNRVPEPFPATSIDTGQFDALTKRIEASHRQLAARLEAGLAAAANETNTLKDLIVGAAKKIALAEEAVQSQRTGAALEREVANLAGRLDRAGEGFASLMSLEQAIDGLSVQLEETRRIASGLPHAAGGEPPAGSLKSSIEHGDDAKRILREIADLRALHEDIWQRVHLALTEIQRSVEQIAKATRGGAGLHGAGVVPSSSDPFAPILTSLAQHGQDGSLAAKVIRPGASDKEFPLAGEAFAADRAQAAGKLQPLEVANGETNGGGREASAASFLIEPGLGYPGRGEESEPRGQNSVPLKAPHDREEAASRTDFIAAARRAARTAQRELQGAAAAKSDSGTDGLGKDGLGKDGMANNGMAKPGVLPFRRGLLVISKRPLVLGGALLFAAIGAFVLTRTLTHNRFGDFMPEFLKQFDRGAVHGKPAGAGEAPANKLLASQTFLSNTSPSPSRASQSHESQLRAGETLGGPITAGGPAATAAAPLDPFAPAETGFSANSASGNSLPAGISSPATRAIAGSDAIMDNTLGQSNAESNTARPRPSAAIIFANALLETAKPAAPAAGASTAQAAPAAAEPAKNLLEEAKSGDAAAQFDLAIRYAEGSAAERNYELAAQWFGKAAEQGLAVAEYRLASLYERGLGVGQDMQRARNLYQRAAEKGNTRAMHNLGVLAVEGPDGKPNYTSAALWFGKAAEYGIRDSQYNLAVLLARGLGLPKDLVKSYTWFAIVAAAGDTDAAKKRDEVAARLTSSELAAANAAAAVFKPRPADADRAANETSPPAAHREAAPAPQGQPAKAKVSGL